MDTKDKEAIAYWFGVEPKDIEYLWGCPIAPSGYITYIRVIDEYYSIYAPGEFETNVVVHIDKVSKSIAEKRNG